MKMYVPIASYNDPEDILDLFPGKPYEGHEGEAIIDHFLHGKGNYHFIRPFDPESFIKSREMRDDPDALIVNHSGIIYAVHFTRGDINLLLKRSADHGYYIDIYELSDPDEWGDEKPEGYENPLKQFTDGELLDRIKDTTEELNELVEELRKRSGVEK